MTDDLYKAAVEKAAREFLDTYFGGMYPPEQVNEMWLYGRPRLEQAATAALEAIGFREIIEALEYYGEVDNYFGGPGDTEPDTIGYDECGNRARTILDRLKSPPQAS